MIMCLAIQLSCRQSRMLTVHSIKPRAYFTLLMGWIQQAYAAT